MSVCVCVCVCVREREREREKVNNGNKSDSMKKIVIQKWWIYYNVKSTLRRFGFMNWNTMTRISGKHLRMTYRNTGQLFCLIRSHQQCIQGSPPLEIEPATTERRLYNWATSPYRTHHHHHHIVLVARISLTLSRHSSQSFIALGRSSGQHPVSSHSCWMYVRAGRPAFARPCVGIHKSTSLMSSSLLLQQCPACLVRLTWIVFVIGGRWPYSWWLVGCCCQDLFRIARSILV